MESIPLAHALSIFPLQTLRFTIRARQTIRLPHFPGSALRSLFGDPLKRTACMSPVKVACKTCQVRKACAYAYLFDTSLENEPARGLADSFPRPYLINPAPVQSGGIRVGDCYQFEIVLIGNAVNFTPIVIESIRSAGEFDGIGASRSKFDLLTVAALSKRGEIIVYPGGASFHVDTNCSADMAAECTEVSISFITPLRLNVRGSYLNEPPSFSLVIERLLERTANLWHGHCSDAPLFVPENLLENAARVELIHAEMFWKDPENDRYSSRQKAPMKIGGMVGGATYQGDITPFLPLLRLGERINIGKATTMGLGRIQVELN